MLQIFIITGMYLVGLSLVIVGPVHAGVTYVLRNYSREEHAFVWMDFKEHALKNLKQSLISSLISLVVTIVLAVNFSFYSRAASSATTSCGFSSRPWSSSCFSLVHHPDVPLSDDGHLQLTLKQLYKNCLLFSILRLPLNILILILSTLILLVIPGVLFFMGYGVTVMLAGIWYLFLAFGLNLLMTNFFVYRALDKYMIKRISAAESLNEETDGESADAERENEPEMKRKKRMSPAGCGNRKRRTRPVALTIENIGCAAQLRER